MIKKKVAKNRPLYTVLIVACMELCYITVSCSKDLESEKPGKMVSNCLGQ